MRFNKVLNLGYVQVHERALAEVITIAVSEIEGVSLAENNLYVRMFEVFGERIPEGIEVRLDERNEVSVDIKIVVLYGMSIAEVAHQIQEKVKDAVKKSIGIILKDINVTIAGIGRATT